MITPDETAEIIKYATIQADPKEKLLYQINNTGSETMGRIFAQRIAESIAADLLDLMADQITKAIINGNRT